MADITLPPEALEAAAKEIARRNGDSDWIAYLPDARAACLAMLNAWPGVWSEQKHVGVCPDVFRWNIVLPLSQEMSDE